MPKLHLLRRVAIFASALAVAASCGLSAGAQSPPDVTGEWMLTTVILGHNLSERLNLKLEKDQLSGTIFRGEKVSLQGTLTGQDVRFKLKESDGSQSEYSGQLRGDAMSGEFTIIQSDAEKLTGPWSARRAPTRPTGPRDYDFVPRDFHRQLSSSDAPVLHIWPGDTVHTTSVDAGGTDEHSVNRVLGGNPLTGPFYVEGAMPGDVLAITIKRLRLNRDWAASDKGMVDRAVTPDYRAKNKPDWSNTRWRLDIEKGLASLEKPSDSLKDFTLPVRPMLGCVGVAPGFGGAPISTGDSGYVGGNMDFNLIGEGATVYLPVSQPGALLYLGDAHALQGDGELNGDALETSMDIQFTVDVRREKSIGTPRVENADYLIAVAYDGSLDGAFSHATSELAQWLQDDYKLSGSDVAVILGTSIQYNIAEVADRNVGLAAKIPKRVLTMVKPGTAPKPAGDSK